MFRNLHFQGERIARIAIDVVFPPRCAGCGRRGVWVCRNCRKHLELLEEPLCLRCGDPIDLCSCSTLAPSLDYARSAAWYDGWMRQAIQAFKYEGEFDRAGHLAEFMRPLVESLDPEVILVPVPLHRDRQNSRGFNQSEKLADYLALHLGRPTEVVLSRTVATRQQIRLSATERATNVSGAFAVAPGRSIAGRRFVLIDDVMTTGSTLGECANELKKAGAFWVGAITVARER